MRRNKKYLTMGSLNVYCFFILQLLYIHTNVLSLEPIVDLLKDEVVQEKIGEVARFFYTNDTVTINLYYAAAAVLLGFLCKSSSSSSTKVLLIPIIFQY